MWTLEVTGMHGLKNYFYAKINLFFIKSITFHEPLKVPSHLDLHCEGNLKNSKGSSHYMRGLQQAHEKHNLK